MRLGVDYQKDSTLRNRDNYKLEKVGAYNVNSIPQFVIIDKQGKIVNLNAPGPGDVEKLLVQEMER